MNTFSGVGSKGDTPRYRIKWRWRGWEPQMQYNAGARDGLFWYPLNREGYWLELGAYNFGKITQHIVMTRAEATRAILRARAINQQHITRVA